LKVPLMPRIKISRRTITAILPVSKPRYGLYLDFLMRHGRLDLTGDVTARVITGNVRDFVAELQVRVRSVTVWNSVYKLRRAVQLIAPDADFGWLTEIEKDVALVAVPRGSSDVR
jgi:hypothetical protein